MKVKIVKLASGYNTKALPGQIFKTKDELIKGLKTARWDEDYDDSGWDDDSGTPMAPWHEDRKRRRDDEELGLYNEDDDRSEFADPHGRSALRAESPSNPRDQACPTCGAENVLTRKDKQLGYQCDNCADAAEGRFGKAKGEQKQAQSLRDEPKGKCRCGGTFFSQRECGADVCDKCEEHKGLARCFCGWSRSGGDGRQELQDMGENIDSDY